MRNFSRFFLLVSLLGCSIAGQASEWKIYKNTAGNFAVRFPGEPQESVNNSSPDVTSHTLMVLKKPVAYTVVYVNMAKTQKVNRSNFVVFRDATFKELPKCKVGPEKPVSPKVKGYIGHRYDLICDTSNVRLSMVGNLYWGKHHAYAVMAMYPDSVSKPDTVNKFIESFAVLNVN